MTLPDVHETREAATPTRAAGVPAFDRDELLRLSRRVDWRFLLPDPRLGRVGVFGPLDDELRGALDRFAGSWSRLAPDGEVRGLDLVIVRAPSPIRWHEVVRALAPGGHVYVEWRRRPLAFAGIGGLRTRLRDSGLEEIRFHWHRPSFRACQEILPAEETTLWSWILGREAQTLRGKLRLGWLRVARRLRSLDRAFPCTSAIARKPGGES